MAREIHRLKPHANHDKERPGMVLLPIVLAYLKDCPIEYVWLTPDEAIDLAAELLRTSQVARRQVGQ